MRLEQTVLPGPRGAVVGLRIKLVRVSLQT